MNEENKENLKFEEALEQLEKIVAAMENKKMPLDDMMKYYEKGKKLSDYCTKILSGFEKKIEILVKENNDGSGEWKEFGEKTDI